MYLVDARFEPANSIKFRVRAAPRFESGVCYRRMAAASVKETGVPSG